jgi:2,4-dienoyl-CoA reductase-like NADH-dependent reductase (Old Yellow Enzyme family)
MPIGIQLAHAGRKASVAQPWKGGGQLASTRAAGGRCAPSADQPSKTQRAPRCPDDDDIARLVEAFAASAKRAVRLGFAAIELHGAHGYLMHQFLSPFSNKREDDYGGSLENRMRFPLEMFDAVRAVVPAGYPVGFRISGTDWVEGGWDIEQTHRLRRGSQSARRRASSTSRAVASRPRKKSRSARAIRCRWRGR